MRRLICILVLTLLLCMWGSPPALGGTVAHWNFEEGTAGEIASGAGTILDIVGGHHGTPINGPVYQASATPNGGAMGLRDDGRDDRVLIPDDPAFKLTGSLTLEAFVTIEDYHHMNHQQIVFRGDDRNSMDPYLLMIERGHLAFSIHGNWRSQIESPDRLPLGELIHVAGVLDDATGEQALYLNGVQVASQVTTARPFADLDPGWSPGLSIGSFQASILHPDSIFKGNIAEVRISDMALTPDQFLLSDILRLGIDIRPGCGQNPVNLGANGVLPVAILGSEDLDVGDIDVSSLMLEGAGPRARGNSGNAGTTKDVNGDSFDDLVLHFEIDDLGVGADVAELVLTGSLLDGTAFTGADDVRTVPLGDANLDGAVNFADFGFLGVNYNQLGGWADGDFNGDGQVDFADFGLLGVNYGWAAPSGGVIIPEPMTLAMLALGGMVLVSRKRELR